MIATLEGDISKGVMGALLVGLSLATAFVVWEINKERLKAWYRWRRRRPNPHTYDSADDLRRDLAAWRAAR